METPHDYFLYFMESHNRKSDQELILAFNSSVGLNCFGIPRGGNLSAIWQQLKDRGIDYSQVGEDGRYLSFKRYVFLHERKLHLLSTLPEQTIFDIIYQRNLIDRPERKKNEYYISYLTDEKVALKSAMDNAGLTIGARELAMGR